jgi:hypothetical protein
MRWRRPCGRVKGGRSLKRLKVPREQKGLRPLLNLEGSERGGRLSGWDEAAEASIPGRNDLVGKRKSGEGKGNLSTIIREEKSSEGRSPRVLGSERGSQGFMRLKERLRG